MKSNLGAGRFQDRFVTLIVAITGALLFGVLWRLRYEFGHYEMYIVANVLTLFFAPMLAIFFIFREEASNFGFAISDSRRVRWLTVAMLVIMLVILIPVSRIKEYQDFYPIFKQFGSFYGGIYKYGDIRGLLYGWASYGLYLFCWEFYFRGYLLFGLYRTIKWPAIIIQAILFGILHLGKVPSEVASSFLAGIILGILALRSKSFLPCFALHWLVSLSMDAFVLMRH
jgi:membrane protease YdiL (CAAX protease family)